MLKSLFIQNYALIDTLDIRFEPGFSVITGETGAGKSIILGAIGLLLGCAMKHYKRSGSTAVAIILTTYFLSILSGMEEKLDFLKYLTPFKYFDAGNMFRTGQMESIYLIISICIVLVCVFGAYWIYNRRDLYI